MHDVAFIHSRYRKAFLKRLSSMQRRLRQRRIPRVSLLPPSHSAWKAICDSGNNQALITLTGVDFETFNWYHEKFKMVYDSNSPFIDPNGFIVPIDPNVGGRPRLMTAADCVALCLAWTRTRGSKMVLQIIFGITGTPVSVYLRFGRRTLIKILKDEPDARILIPGIEKIREYQAAINERHPNLENVWCCMDGLKLYLEEAGDATTQNNYYNGWKQDHYVSSVFVFCPDGTIPICCYNVPGSVHDSTVAEWGNVYQRLEKVYTLCGGRCAVDSAFSMKRYPFLVKSSDKNPFAENSQDFLRRVEINAEVTSMRQSAEWGMHAIQSSFPCLKERFIYEEQGERRIILKMMILLYNVRAQRVGMNQIRNTYMAALNVDADNMFT